MPTVSLPDGKTVDFPEGMSIPQMEAAMQEYMTRTATAEPSQDIAKAVSMPARGFNESLATTIGAPFDLAGAGINLVGGGINAATDALGMGRPVPPVTTDYTDLARRGLQALTGPEVKPETGLEKVLYGGGKGVGDAASVFIPAAAASKAVTNPMASALLKNLAAAPAAQALAGGTGGAVTEATGSPWAGLAASMAVPMAASTVSRALTPVKTGLDPQRAQLVEKALQENIPLTPAQRTGSRPLRIMEGALDTLPTTAGQQEAMRGAQREAFNAASLTKSGTAGTKATPEVIATAKARIGGVINDVSKRNTMAVGDDFRTMLDAFDDYAKRYFSPDQSKALKGVIRDIRTADKNFKGAIPGEVYKNLDSNIGSLTKAAQGRVREKLGELRQAFRSVMDDSIAPADKELWDTARRQYANLMVTRDAASGAGEAVALGNVSPKALRTALNRSGGREAYGAGFGDQNDLARIGQALLPAEADSGTAGRTMMTQLLTGGAGGTSAAQAMMGDPVSGAMTMAAFLALPKVIQKAYYSKMMASYLTKGVPGAEAITGALPTMNRDLAAALLAGRVKSLTAEDGQ